MAKPTEQIAAELQRIYKRDKELKSATVLKEARPKKSILHPEFEWEDSIAAEEYRLYQARHLIRSVRVTESGAEGEKDIKVPMFVHVRSDQGEGKEGVYHTKEFLLENPNMYMRALDEARAALRSAHASIQHLERMANESGKESNVVALVGIAEKGLMAAIEAVKNLAA